MFIGHYAAGFATKKFAPRLSLGTLFFAAQFLDLLWPIFLLLRIEHVRIDPGNTLVTPLDFYEYPFTHSLVSAGGWALVFGLVYFSIRRHWKGTLILAAAVLSHWALDLIVHRPDLPLFLSGGPYYGLGVWNSLGGSMMVELGIFVVGLLIYVRSTVAQDRIGHYALWALTAFLLITWAANLLGPPPPSETAVAIAGLALWLLVPWAYWIDRHRKPGRSAE
ncbi:MAG: hypothetical protein ACE5H0_04025 [Bacteroidota bacterium]